MKLYFLFLIGGSLIFLGMNYLKAVQDPKYSWITFFKLNLPVCLINIIIGALMILSKEDLVGIYPITKISCAVIGTAGQAVWSKIITLVAPKTVDKVIEQHNPENNDI